jgi:hypothetical protein
VTGSDLEYVLTVVKEFWSPSVKCEANRFRNPQLMVSAVRHEG